VQKYSEYEHSHMIKVLGQVVAEIRAQAREHCNREVGAVKRELEQQRRELTVSLREQVLECGRTLREEAKAAREHLEQADAATCRELELSKRELALLQREIGLERAVRVLHDEVEAAKTEIPRLPEIEARVGAKQSKLAAEQKRLGEELAKQKDRIGKLRVDQSVTEYGLKEDLKELKRAQQPVVELKFESVDGQFTMRDMHPDAAAAWRRFVRELTEANDGTMSTNDPTGRVVALPRKNGNVA
jgi:chromosome segregation ATPase